MKSSSDKSDSSFLYEIRLKYSVDQQKNIFYDPAIIHTFTEALAEVGEMVDLKHLFSVNIVVFGRILFYDLIKSM